ncbi:MAG: YkvA family protein [Rhodothermales bacterium]
METSPDAKLSKKQRSAFAIASGAAAQVIKRRFRVLSLARDAYAKLAKNEDALEEVKEDLRALTRYARAWAKREYRAVPWRSLLYAVAGLIYFVNPIDLVPDALLGIGFIDDVAVIGFVAGALRKDLNDFRDWETGEAAPTRLRTDARKSLPESARQA